MRHFVIFGTNYLKNNYCSIMSVLLLAYNNNTRNNNEVNLENKNKPWIYVIPVCRSYINKFKSLE